MATDNSSRLWWQKATNQNAVRRAAEEIQKSGKALPCHVVAVSGSIVTVAFDLDLTYSLPQITIPKLESYWLRTPTQVGDKGMTVPADAYLYGVSGLGKGTPDLTKPGNLSALTFVPVGNSGWSLSDSNTGLSQGPNGWILQTTDGNSSVTVNSSGVTLKFGSKTVVLDSSGLTIDGILFDTHTHLYTPGSGTPTDTGGPL